MMLQGTDSDLCTILREYPNILWPDYACIDCFGGKVIQLLETFQDIHEERYDRDIGSNNSIGSNEYS